MSDFSVTATSVVPTTSTGFGEGTAGASVTAGMPIYLDTSDNTLKPCDADASASSVAVGVALHSASAGQPLKYAKSGNVTFNAAFTAGAIVCVSTTAGGLAPYADLGSGDFVTIIGVATSTTNLFIKIVASQAAKA